MRLPAKTILACLMAASLSGSSVSTKLEAIEQANSRAGSRFQFSPSELNSWVRDEARARAPQGVRNIRLDLANGRATGYAQVDFLKLRQAQTGEAPGWLMKNLFAGERPVTVTARLDSRHGRARVDVERLEVSGVPIEGAALDFLIQDYVRPMFPAAKVSEWFPLAYRVDHLTVSPSGVTVFTGR